MDRQQAFEEINDRIDRELELGDPPVFVKAVSDVGEVGIHVSDSSLEMAERTAAEKDTDPIDELEEIVRASVDAYEKALR
jgi:hypothetical protein